MMVLFAVLVAVAFIGGMLTVFKAGAKDGICKYDNKDE